MSHESAKLRSSIKLHIDFSGDKSLVSENWCHPEAYCLTNYSSQVHFVIITDPNIKKRWNSDYTTIKFYSILIGCRHNTFTTTFYNSNLKQLTYDVINEQGLLVFEVTVGTDSCSSPIWLSVGLKTPGKSLSMLLNVRHDKRKVLHLTSSSVGKVTPGHGISRVIMRNPEG